MSNIIRIENHHEGKETYVFNFKKKTFIVNGCQFETIDYIINSKPIFGVTDQAMLDIQNSVKQLNGREAFIKDILGIGGMDGFRVRFLINTTGCDVETFSEVLINSSIICSFTESEFKLINDLEVFKNIYDKCSDSNALSLIHAYANTIKEIADKDSVSKDIMSFIDQSLVNQLKELVIDKGDYNFVDCYGRVMNSLYNSNYSDMSIFDVYLEHEMENKSVLFRCLEKGLLDKLVDRYCSLNDVSQNVENMLRDVMVSIKKSNTFQPALPELRGIALEEEVNSVTHYVEKAVGEISEANFIELIISTYRQNKNMFSIVVDKLLVMEEFSDSEKLEIFLKLARASIDSVVDYSKIVDLFENIVGLKNNDVKELVVKVMSQASLEFVSLFSQTTILALHSFPEINIIKLRRFLTETNLDLIGSGQYLSRVLNATNHHQLDLFVETFKVLNDNDRITFLNRVGSLKTNSSMIANNLHMFMQVITPDEITTVVKCLDGVAKSNLFRTMLVLDVLKYREQFDAMYKLMTDNVFGVDLRYSESIAIRPETYKLMKDKEFRFIDHFEPFIHSPEFESNFHGSDLEYESLNEEEVYHYDEGGCFGYEAARGFVV